MLEGELLGPAEPGQRTDLEQPSLASEGSPPKDDRHKFRLLAEYRPLVLDQGGPLRRTVFRQRVWLPAVRRAGFAGVRFHDLRHTAAALAIRAGAHPKAIQERLGHASITTTLNTYGHLFPAIDEELAGRLDELARSVRRGTDAGPLRDGASDESSR